VAVASLTTRRIIAGAAIAGLFLISAIVSDVLVGTSEEVVEASSAGPPATALTPDGEYVPADPEAFEPGDRQTDVYYVVRTEPTAAALLNLWTLPLVVRDLVFLGSVEPGHALSGLDGGGILAILELTAIAVVALVVLLRRYHEVER
jgi:hypothetical protein